MQVTVQKVYFCNFFDNINIESPKEFATVPLSDDKDLASVVIFDPFSKEKRYPHLLFFSNNFC